MDADALRLFAAAKYVRVTTFRRSGVAVPTPVWHAIDGDTVVIWSTRDAGKVKRLRNDGRVLLAPCTFKGEPTGPEIEAHGEILDGPGSATVRRLIARRYGIVGRLTMLGSRLRRGSTGTLGIRIR
ncbi:MAG: PPOX class F420-dependent oxidoreductase [Actinocatenispora sp.]